MLQGAAFQSRGMLREVNLASSSSSSSSGLGMPIAGEGLCSEVFVSPINPKPQTLNPRPLNPLSNGKPAKHGPSGL